MSECLHVVFSLAREHHCVFFSRGLFLVFEKNEAKISIQQKKKREKTKKLVKQKAACKDSGILCKINRLPKIQHKTVSEALTVALQLNGNWRC